MKGIRDTLNKSVYCAQSDREYGRVDDLFRGSLVLQRRVMRKHAWVFFSSYGLFIMGDSHSFVASFKMRARVIL